MRAAIRTAILHFTDAVLWHWYAAFALNPATYGLPLQVVKNPGGTVLPPLVRDVVDRATDMADEMLRVIRLRRIEPWNCEDGCTNSDCHANGCKLKRPTRRAS
jgi:hypothetical protein